MNDTPHHFQSSFEPFKPMVCRSEISIKENSPVYRLKMDMPMLCGVFRIDGQIISKGERCDFLIPIKSPVDNDWVEVFVELKGTDVSHAIDQIAATLRHASMKYSYGRRHARIVARSIPSQKNNPSVEKRKIKFKSEFTGIDLKILKSNQPDKLS